MIDYQKHRQRWGEMIKVESSFEPGPQRRYQENLLRDGQELLDKAEKWDKQADNAKGEPSEQDIRTLEKFERELRIEAKGEDITLMRIAREDWIIDKLKQAWGME